MINAYLLAGGRSTRMGQDKGLAPLNGRPLCAYGLDALRACFSQVFIITAQQEYAQFGLPLLPDLHPDCGPLGGIYTGLRHSGSAYSFFLACDMPFVSPAIIHRIMAQASDADAILPIANARLQPLCGMYHKRCILNLEKSINAKNYRMMHFIEGMICKKIEINSDIAFENVNTPELLEKSSFLMKNLHK
jgi:molybdopterin-guanine dinucleotide biosynthesis protein A